jgi:hypothetical protein
MGVGIMVTFCQVKRFECDRCGDLSTDIDDYYDHAKETHTEEPIERRIDEWHCEVCKKSYDKKLNAQLCETTHQTNDDKQYQAFLEQQEKTKLLIEGNKPNQKKLSDVK